MGTKQHSNYESLITFTRASAGHALRPVSYGDELVINGTFDSDVSGWTILGASATATWNSSGYVDLDRNGGSSALFRDQLTVEAGKVYLLSFDILAVSHALRPQVNSTNITASVLNATGSYAVSFVAPSSAINLDFSLLNNVNATASLDNISVKEVTFDESDGTLTLFEHPDNVPRVEWDADGNRLGLLVEEARTNLVTYSEDLSNAEWTKVNSSITANAITAPDGTLTADFLVPDTSAGNHLVRDNISVGASQHSFSVYLKKGGYIWAALVHVDGDINTYTQWFNLETGTLGSGDATGSITDVGNGWYRCSITPSSAASATNASNQFIYVGEADNDAFFTGDGTSGIYAWGAQLEVGSFPTSYIKNEGASGGVTRSADVASIPVADFGFNNSNEGSLFVECADISFKAGGTAYPVILQIGNGLNANDRRGFFIAESANQVAAEVISSGVGVAYLALDTHTNGRIESTKLAFRMAENNFAGTDDGTSVVTDTSGTVTPSSPLSIIGIGRNTTGGGHLNGHIKSIKYYPRRLTDAQLQDLTS